VRISRRDRERCFVVVLGEKLAVLRDPCDARHGELDDRLWPPTMYPLLLSVQIVYDQVDLGEGSLLNFGSLLVRRAVLDVVQVVFVRLHAHLAVGVLLIGNRLQKSHVVPVLDVVVRLNGLLQIFVVFAFSSFLNAFVILSDEQFLRLGHTRTIAVRRVHVQSVDVVLLSQAHLRLALGVDLPIQEADGRRLAVFSLLVFLLCHRDLHEALGGAEADRVRALRWHVLQFVELMEDLPIRDIAYLLLNQLFVLAAEVESRDNDESPVIRKRCWLFLIALDKQRLHFAGVKLRGLRLQKPKGLRQVARQDLASKQTQLIDVWEPRSEHVDGNRFGLRLSPTRSLRAQVLRERSAKSGLVALVLIFLNPKARRLRFQMRSLLLNELDSLTLNFVENVLKEARNFAFAAPEDALVDDDVICCCCVIRDFPAAIQAVHQPDDVFALRLYGALFFVVLTEERQTFQVVSLGPQLSCEPV